MDSWTDDWKALAGAVQKRRAELRLAQDLSDRGGPGEMTVRKIERAEGGTYRPATLRGLEQALEWPRGRCRQILSGEVTEPLDIETEAEAERLTTTAGILVRIDKYETLISDAMDRGEVGLLAGSDMLLRFAAFRARLLGH